MKQSELNHLRRLLGWVRCEIGQTPEEMVAMVESIAHKLGNAPIGDEAKRRMVEQYDGAQKVPKYVREAVKALEKLTGPGAEIDDTTPRTPTRQQIAEAGERVMRRMHERGMFPVVPFPAPPSQPPEADK
jgi:hypothetical protein